MSDWLTNTETEITTVVKLFGVTDHGCFAGDGEGGADKRAVTDFIRNELTWRAKLPNWPVDGIKPVVRNAETAHLVASTVRAKTKWEKNK